MRSSSSVREGRKSPLLLLFIDRYARDRITVRSAKTTRSLRIVVRHFARFLGRPAHVADLTDSRIRDYWRSRLDDQVAQATAFREAGKLISLANHAARLRLLRRFPALKLPSAPQEIPRCYTIDHLKTLLAAGDRLASQRQTEMIGGLRAFVRVAFDSGERTGALLRAEWSWLDLTTGWLTVPAAARKKGQQSRIYRLRPETIAALDALRTVGLESRRVFPWRHPTTFYLWWKKLLREAGLPVDRKYGPQRIRRSHASYLEAAGGDATASLGHSSRGVTVRSYLDPTITQTRPPSDLLPEI